MKNYALHEASTMNFSLYTKNLKVLSKVASYQPCETNVFRDVSGFLNSVYVDRAEDGTPILYDVPSCSIMELKGPSSTVPFSFHMFSLLLEECMDDVSDKTLLYYLHTRFIAFSKKYPRRFINNFLGFIFFAFKDPSQLRLINYHSHSLSEDD